uniref:Uncharacterized protein n=1 Tax=Oryza sativa subsp. japonica TaxID=39947 RepID=Q6K5P0_ORYSJ|nr:hypothetical protein [Oryza sativa Japonica Group]
MGSGCGERSPATASGGTGGGADGAKGGGAHGRDERKKERGSLTEAMTATGAGRDERQRRFGERTAGQSWAEMESSPACEGGSALATFSGKRVAAEVALAAAELTAAAAWRGGGPSGDSAWLEMAATAEELREGRTWPGRWPKPPATWGGERERVGWDSIARARGGSDGAWAASWGGRGNGAVWAREEQRRWSGNGGCRRGRTAGGWGRPDRWGPPVGVPKGGGGGAGRPKKEMGARRRWGGLGRRPKKRKKEEKEKEKEERIFPGI